MCYKHERNIQTNFESGKQFGRSAVSVDVDGFVASGACAVISAANGRRPRKAFVASKFAEYCGKSEGFPVTCHEGTLGEQRCSSTHS